MLLLPASKWQCTLYYASFIVMWHPLKNTQGTLVNDSLHSAHKTQGLLFLKKKVGGVGGIKFSHGSDLHLHNPWGNWDKHQNNCYYPWRGCFFSFQQWNSICCNQEWLLPWRGIILFCNKLSQKCWVSSLLNKHISKFKHTHFWSKPDSYEIFYI